MFQLKGWLDRARAWLAAGGRRRPPSDIAVLLITQDPHAGASLARIAARSGWRRRIAASVGEAAALLAGGARAVVVLDRDLPGEDWRHGLPLLARLPQAAGVLLASTADDEQLWQDVSRHHGQDVLRKPFAYDETVRAVELAWSFRQLGRS
jgi:DNA-binding response OmpR family regulator